MNQTPVINTATAVGAGAVVAPVVAYAATLFHLTLPVDVQSALVVLIVAGAHKLSQIVTARSNAKGTLIRTQVFTGAGTTTFVPTAKPADIAAGAVGGSGSQ